MSCLGTLESYLQQIFILNLRIANCVQILVEFLRRQIQDSEYCIVILIHMP